MNLLVVLFTTLSLLLSLWIPDSFSDDVNQASLSEEELAELEASVEDTDYRIVEGFDPNDLGVGRGHINMAAMKPGECPIITCDPLTKPKPCPEAKPAKAIIDWQGLKCEVCPYKWDIKSCKGSKAREEADGSATSTGRKPQKMETKEL